MWFETALFDLDRPLDGDVVWLDTISGSAIVHGVLSREHSAFHALQPDSALSVSRPFSGLRLFHFTVSDDNIHAAMLAADAAEGQSVGNHFGQHVRGGGYDYRKVS